MGRAGRFAEHCTKKCVGPRHRHAMPRRGSCFPPETAASWAHSSRAGTPPAAPAQELEKGTKSVPFLHAESDAGTRLVPRAHNETGRQSMKHATTRELYDYWNRVRGGERAPLRSAIEPSDIRRILGEMFILE